MQKNIHWHYLFHPQALECEDQSHNYSLDQMQQVYYVDLLNVVLEYFLC